MNPTASVFQGRIVLNSPYSLRELAKSVAGRTWDKRLRVWTWAANRDVAEEIRERFRRYGLLETSEFKHLVETPVVPALQTIAADKPIPLTTTDPWQHQQIAFWFAVDCFGGALNKDKAKGGCALNMDMGTGKSRTTIDIIRNYGFRNVLILCPKAVVNVWAEEFKKHWSEEFRVTTLGKGTSTVRGKRLLKAIEKGNDGLPVVVVLNYEATIAQGLSKVLPKVHWGLLVADEVHRLKSAGGRTSRFVYQLGRRVNARLGLTGTLMPHSPLDVYGIYRFLDDKIFGTSFTMFKNRYAIQKRMEANGHGFNKIIGFQNEGELSRNIGRIAYQVAADDVLDLPEEHHVRRPVDLDRTTRDRYTELERDFVAEVRKDLEIAAPNVLTKLLRLQQLTGGFLVNPNTGSTLRLSTEKIDVTREILEDLSESEPVVIFCRFKPDMDALGEMCASLGRRSYFLRGGVNELEEWKGARDGAVLIVQVQSGKEGIDLTKASYAICFSLGFSLGDYLQLLRRQRRPGQTASRVTYFHLVATGTVDVKVYSALSSRKKVVDSILQEVRSYAQGQ